MPCTYLALLRYLIQGKEDDETQSMSSRKDSSNANGIVDETVRLQRCLRMVLWAVASTIVLMLATLAVAAATLAIVDNRWKTSNTDTSQAKLNSVLAETMDIRHVMAHLRELQAIGIQHDGTRAVNTLGFNRTLDYIQTQLTSHTNFLVQKTFFNVRDFVLARSPKFMSSINNDQQSHLYSSNLTEADFYHVQYSTSIDLTEYTSIAVIPNFGCTDDDWRTAQPEPVNHPALVKRGSCDFVVKARFATKYGASAILFYNDGTTSDRLQPILTNLGRDNELPALFLSYTLGQKLVNAIRNPSNDVKIRMTIDVVNEQGYPVGNICADTPTGDVTQTIVIGSHSDSVPAGPGINDNGQSRVHTRAHSLATSRLF
jgi:hypothetical protein